MMKNVVLSLALLTLAQTAFADVAHYVHFGAQEVQSGKLKAVAKPEDVQSAPLARGSQVILLVPQFDDVFCNSDWERHCYAENSQLFFRTHRTEAFRQIPLDSAKVSVVSNPDGSNSVVHAIPVDLNTTADGIEVYANFSSRSAVYTGYFDSVGKKIYEPGTVVGTQWISNYGRNFSVSVSR